MRREKGNPLRGLPDHLRPGLDVVFVGINPGIRSAETGHHYAGHSNRFWKLLYEAQLVPEPLTFDHDGLLPSWGYGLTNLVLRPTPGVADLTRQDFEEGRRILLAKIARFKPRVVALVGITVFDHLFPTAKASWKSGLRGKVKRIGLQPETLGESVVFVLPNPSGRNAHYSHAQMLAAFLELRAYLTKLSPGAAGNNSVDT